MSMIFFTFRAQTAARRGAMILRDAGIRARVGRTPGFLATGGCGYGIWVGQSDARQAAGLLRRSGYSYERSYRIENGIGQEVRL